MADSSQAELYTGLIRCMLADLRRTDRRKERMVRDPPAQYLQWRDKLMPRRGAGIVPQREYRHASISAKWRSLVCFFGATIPSFQYGGSGA